jgi:hypothetical protein
LEWFIYIPEEGDWIIDYKGKDPKKARQKYLKWSNRKRIPKNSKIWSR